MREELLDVLERLMGVRKAMGDVAFQRACHSARVAIAKVALEQAEQRSGKWKGLSNTGSSQDRVNQARLK